MDNQVIGLAIAAGASFVGWVVKEVREVAPLKEVVAELKEDTKYVRGRVDDIHDYLLSRTK